MHNVQNPIERLPHGPSVRMISRVIEHRAGQIKVIKHWPQDDLHISDHFTRGPPIVPGVFLAEQVARSALLLAILDGLIADSDLFILGNLRCDFLAQAIAPCSVVAVTIITGRARGFVGFQGECQVGNTPTARIKGTAAPGRAPL